MQDLDMKDVLYIGKRNEGWMKEFWREKQRERELKKKEYKSQTRARTLANRRAYIYIHVEAGMPGNFSMAPAELEFSLIFTFSRHPPRGSAIVRAASLRPPTTITEKMQRTAAEYTYLPTYLPTYPNNPTARGCR